jgi:hypothetical protein
MKEYENAQQLASTSNPVHKGESTSDITSILRATEENPFTLEPTTDLTQNQSFSLSSSPSLPSSIPLTTKSKLPTKEELGLLSSLLDLCEGEYRKRDAQSTTSSLTKFPQGPAPPTTASITTTPPTTTNMNSMSTSLIVTSTMRDDTVTKSSPSQTNPSTDLSLLSQPPQK